MFKNYIKIALRNIKMRKGYSFINIAGLAVGLSCCILILLYIRYEFSYDKYHNDAQHIYRVVREHQGRSVWNNSSEHPLAASLKEDFSEVIKATRVKKNDEVGVVEYNSKRFNEEGIDFAFPTQTLFLAGDSRRPLSLVPEVKKKANPERNSIMP